MKERVVGPELSRREVLRFLLGFLASPPPPKEIQRTLLPLISRNPSPILMPRGTKAGLCYPFNEDNLLPRWSKLPIIGCRTVQRWTYGYPQGSPNDALKAISHGIEYLPTLYNDRINVKTLEAFTRRFKGARWLFLNEPDLASQANLTPEEAAIIYDTFYNTIKQIDRTARVYVCGTAFNHAAFLRQWAQAYADRHHGHFPPIDGIHLHSYAPPQDGSTQNWQRTIFDLKGRPEELLDFWDRLQSQPWARPELQDWEKNIFDFKRRQEELLAFRQWQQSQPWAKNKPVIVSEWGVLSASWFPDHARRIAQEYLPAMWPWLQAQPWIETHLWFCTWCGYGLYASSNTHIGPESHLLTPVGGVWRDLALSS